MELKEVVIPYKRSKADYRLYLFGDLHLGTIYCAEDEAKEVIREIVDDEMSMVIGMGDYAECITPRDKRWEPNQSAFPDWVEQDNIAECQRKHVVELLKPIKHKFIGLLYGNHEDNIRRYNHDNIHKNICEDLEVDSLGYSCFIHFIFRREKSNEAHLIKGMFTHGTGSARTPGGRLNYLKRTMDAFEASMFGYAHTHDIQIYSPEILATTESKIITAKGKIGALTGCWFRTYTQGAIASYGEVKVYHPTRIGCPCFIINPNENMIEAKTPPISWGTMH